MSLYKKLFGRLVIIISTILIFIIILEKVQIHFEESNKYISMSDYPFFLNSKPYIAANQNGYYFFNESGTTLIFFDKLRKQSFYVCNQSNCAHGTLSCNAFFDPSIVGQTCRPFIWLNNNHIYLLGKSTDKEFFCLYSLDLDGSNRKKEFDLSKIPEGKNIRIEAAIHRGYLYYSIIAIGTDNTSAKLYRKSLSPKFSASELLFEIEGTEPEIYRIKGFGNKIYFQCNSNDLNYTEAIGIYSFDTKSSRLQMAKEGAIKEYIIVDSMLYYCTDAGIYMRNLESGNEKIFYETNAATSISYDGTYFYIDNFLGLLKAEESYKKRNIVVLDTNGELIDIINLESGIHTCLYGDNDYLFAFWQASPDDLTGQSWIGAFDKTQIGTKSHYWIPL